MDDEGQQTGTGHEVGGDASDAAGEGVGNAGAADTAERELDALVGEWLPLPDVAELLGVDITRVRRLVDDRQLVAVRRGKPRVLSVPRALADPEPLPDLSGTVTLLLDAGYTSEEALRWLFTPDESLPGTPVEALRSQHRKTEVRRRAQALAF